MKAFILAAEHEKGVQMKTPWILQKIMGKPMLQYSVEACVNAGIDNITVVLNSDKEVINEAMHNKLSYIEQRKQLSSAYAVAEACQDLKPDEDVLVLYADMPLIDVELIKNTVHFYSEANADAVIVGVASHNYTSESLNDLASDKLRRLIGICLFNVKALREALNYFNETDAGKDAGISDVFIYLLNNKNAVRVYSANIPVPVYTRINNYAQLAEAEAFLRAKINARHMDNGVRMLDPSTTYIDASVEIAENVVLYPGVILEGKCKLDAGVIIGANSQLFDTTVGRDTHMQNSVLSGASVGSNTEIGPFAYLRPGAVIGDNCRVGDFVEVKNSIIGNRTKVAHLGYIGDSDIGENVNWGCGAITANYDGKNKSRTTVMDNVFIGCNSNLIAPVTIGEGAFIAAGSTITDEVPPASLAVARQRQVVKTSWKGNKYTE